MRLLSTKIVSSHFKDELIKIGISIIEYPIIKIDPLYIKIDHVRSILIFTSQNAVKIVFESSEIVKKIKNKKCFCVGQKTKLLLNKKGINVIKMFESAADLARFLVKNHKKDSFSFFCGRQRRSEIETSLNQCKMDLDIHEVYKTTYTSKYFENCFDGILFFSPSAVSSYFIKNTWPESAHGFCIGSSTSKTLSKFTSNFSTAKNPTENQLLNIIHKYYVEK